MIANSLVVNGAARFLNKIYANDLQVSGTTSFTDLSVTGNASINGTINIGSSNNANTIINLNGKRAIAGVSGSDYLWLRINDTKAFSNGVYFGSSVIRTDGQLLVGRSGSKLAVTTTDDQSNISGATNGHALFGVPIEMNGTANYWDTTGKLVTSNLDVNSARITNLQVTDTLRSFKWDIDHVANLGGNFLVTPTYNAIENSATFAVNSISGTTITATINDSTAISGSILGGVTWAKDSKIKITGKIGGVVLPVCEGKLTNQLNNSSGAMNIQFTYPNQSSNGLSAKTYGASEVSGLTVMLLTVGATNPIGIYMTARDSNNYSHISLYGGTSVNPTVRIGNLQGLPAVNGVSPDDLDDKWGIYTSNGFFSGTIVSSSGKIGNFNLTDKLYTGSHNTWNHASNGIYIASDGIAGGNGGTWYLWNDGTGKIGKYIFASNGALTTGSGSTQAGMGDSTYAFWAGSSTTSSAPFRVTYAGKLTSISGTIGGWTIGTSDLHNGTNSMTSKTAGLYLGTGGIRNYASDTAYANIQNGVITAVGVNISGTITATTGTFGNGTNKITIGNGGTANSAIYYGMTTLSDTTHDGFYIGTDGITLGKGSFKVTSNGTIYASSGSISGSIISTGISAANITSDTLSAARIAAGSLALEKLTTAAQTTISDAAKTATTYITDIDTKKGITIKPSDSSGNDYLQINSSAISFYRNNVQTTKMEDSAIRVGKLGTNLRNVYITDSAVQIRNNTDVLAEYGSTIKLYKPGSPTTAVVTIDSNGGSFTGSITATSGTIGSNSTAGNRWQIGDKAIYNTTNSMTSKEVGIYVGVDGIRNYKDDNTFVNIQNGKITAKAVDLTGKITATEGEIGGASISNGVLQIKEANISGTISGNKITATSIEASKLNITDLQAIGATIGGFAIDTTSIHTKNVEVTSYADNSIALSSTDFIRTINSTSREGLRFAIGDKFGVTGDGTIYASGVNITGVITATSGTIGGWTVNNSYGLYTNSKTTATSTNTGILIQKDGGIYAGPYDETEGACSFQVTSSGAMRCVLGRIGGWSISADGIRNSVNGNSIGLLPGTNTAGTFIYVSKTENNTSYYPFAVYNSGISDFNSLYENKTKKLRIDRGTLYGYYDGTQYGILDLTADYGNSFDVALSSTNSLQIHAEKNINFYEAANINLTVTNDINLTATRDINSNATRDFYVTAADSINLRSGSEIYFAYNISSSYQYKNYLSASGLHLNSTTQGIFSKDSANREYAMIYDNGNNLCIGHTAGANYHHAGGTYISTGWNGSEGNETIYVSVPHSNSTSGGNTLNTYGVWHKGNLNIKDITSSITLTKSTNCSSVTLNKAYRFGPLVYLNFTATANSGLASGAGVDITYSGPAPYRGSDSRLGFGVYGVTLCTAWWNSATTIRCRMMSSGAWNNTQNVIFTGWYFAAGA